MTVYTLTATQVRANPDVVPGQGHAYKAVNLTYTTELAAAEATSTINFGNIPSNARISGASRIYWDDLATTGSPTLDIGLFAVNSNITSDVDAINDGMDLATVNSTVGLHVVKDIANFGKKAYEFVSGQTTDPGGLLTIKGSVLDASTTATGTLTLDLWYTID